LTGEVPLDGALSSGLVSECIESSSLQDVVSERVASIGTQLPAAVRATKHLSSMLRGDRAKAYDIGDSFATSMLSSRIVP